ncbi:PREDICTED: C2H2 [Prunus dulcis]|uniref:PREDICTED: C2H2 n=1 Tax=Prunus dulcis TaxID=3755 RepID=A0A5E4G8F1_PRUDU|nr:PREDICTED: C2H2 [Prunus dulcis]VVA38123.1 PREDICTED: C2H2 [Prunus dulcis]
MIAYANRHALDYVPQVVRERKERNMVVIRDGELNVCRVCGRRFYTNEKLLNHIKIHERQHANRLNQIESAKGSGRAKLVGKYSMKMEKYKNAARDVLTPRGQGFGRAECLMLASGDSDFVDVVMEAELRCLKTVVVGDFGDGALKRVADLGRRTYKPDEEQSVHSWDDEIDGESEEEEIEGIVGGGVNDNLGKDDSGRWWELDFDADASKC